MAKHTSTRTWKHETRTNASIVPGVRTKTADRMAKMAVHMPLLTANIARRCKTSAVLATNQYQWYNEHCLLTF